MASSEATVRASATWSPRMEYRRIGLEQFTQGRGIEVNRMGDDQLRLRIPTAFAFVDRSAAPTLELRDLLGRLAASIRKDEPVFITITSYPDSAPHPDPAALAQGRVNNVTEVLSAGGVVAARIQAGQPPTQPVRDKLDIWVRDASKPKAP